MFNFGKKKATEDTTKNAKVEKSVDENAEKEIPVKKSFFQRLKEGLQKTREKLSSQLKSLFTIGSKIDQAKLDELEVVLLSSDMGYEIAENIKKSVGDAYRHKEVKDDKEIRVFIQEEIKKILKNGLEKTGTPLVKINPTGPTIVTIIGVNGSGKTTSIAKLTKHLKSQNYKVMVAAADTFRAAAVEQLTIWSQRLGVPIIKPAQSGVDPASVVFDATNAAVQQNVDFLLIDTAGRLHTQKDLMDQLTKMHNVIKKKIPDAPHETILILDGTTGQNAVMQGLEFGKTHKITGLVMTKLDGTAKGGVLIRMCKELQIPVRYIGVGEQIDDLEVFNVDKYVDALFE